MLRRTAVIAVSLAAASTAWAIPMFSISPASIELQPGASMTAEVRAVGTGSVGAMDLYLVVTAPYQLSSIKVHQTDASTVWVGKSPNGVVGEYGNDPWGFGCTHQQAYGIVTINGSWVPATDGSTVVARVTITAPAGTPEGTQGTLTTNTWPDYPSTWGGVPPAGHETASIRVVPEPVTLTLLALGAVGMVRRRRHG